MRKLYLAYGSNMDLDQMELRCPDASIVTTVTLEGWRLMFKGSKSGNYATIERDKGCQVPALLWEISDADERSLDHYEGYPTFYYKEYLWVDGYGPALVYIMHEERRHGVPSRYYYNLLDKAYRLLKMPHQILREAVLYSAERA